MDSIICLRTFLRISENGSFSQTARELGLSQSTVSKHVSSLERLLKAKLLIRTTRQLKLTEAGLKYQNQAQKILEIFDQASAEVRDIKTKPSGVIRLSTTNLIGRKFIVPLLAEFQEAYSDIRIDHYLGEAYSDLIVEGLDLALRLGQMADSSHRAVKLGALTRVTVASKTFLQRHGTPKNPAALAKFPCVLYTGAEPIWDYGNGAGGITSVKVAGSYRANNTEAMKAACLEGLGIFRGSTTAVFEELQNKRLVQILKPFELDPVPVHAVTPNNQYLPRKVAVLVEFLRERLKQEPTFNPKLSP